VDLALIKLDKFESENWGVEDDAELAELISLDQGAHKGPGGEPVVEELGHLLFQLGMLIAAGGDPLMQKEVEDGIVVVGVGQKPNNPVDAQLLFDSLKEPVGGCDSLFENLAHKLLMEIDAVFPCEDFEGALEPVCILS